MEKDEELADKEFLENVFQAASVGDKLYCIIPGFSVNTVVGKQSLLGDRQGWDYTEFKELMDSMPEGTQGFAETTKSSFISQIMYYCSQDFVDPATGKCNFNSPDFIGLLEYANTFPDEINYDDFDENYWMNYQDQYRTGQTVLQQTNLYNVAAYKYLVFSFGEEVSFVGYPTQSKQGNSLSISNSISVSSKSGNKEGAWEFVRTFLLDEYQESGYDGMPVRKDIFMEKAKEAMERPYYMDGDQKVEYDETNYINGEEVIMPPLTQEQVDKVVAFIETVNKPMTYEPDLENIITEEAAPFFQGQKSAAEVAEIIQSRAQIYVNENR
jgi:ABC-type glycerol-3-phosphate transport system substrate-binding protein